MVHARCSGALTSAVATAEHLLVQVGFRDMFMQALCLHLVTAQSSIGDGLGFALAAVFGCGGSASDALPA